MAHDAFISHSSKDKTIADAVCGTLEGKNIRCWIAPRDVPPGTHYGAALDKAIENSKIFILLISKGSNNSDQVIRELEIAADNGIPIIPIRIEDIEPTDAMRYYVKSLHWLDALTPPLERHLEKITASVQALLSINAEEKNLPAVETTLETPHPKRSPLPLWASILIGLAALVIVGGGTWFILNRSKLNKPVSESIPTTVGALDSVAPSLPLTSNWRPVSFLFPNPQIWDLTIANQYTAIDQRDSDVYAWSTESYQGDISVSLELRSSVEALDLSYEEMQNQIPSQNSGCLILFGDGTLQSYGSLVFCIDWDGYFIDTHYRRYDEEFLTYVLHDNPSETVYAVTVEVIDDMASMYVNGEKVLSTFFDPEEISPSGRIGLFKYWVDGEITFSNIQVRTSSSTEN
ncbi:MAG: toll/interleukin-1 receptor domain-containing protein [Anaerolineales bacterium]|nr:toll/interleukin-1 receptor domain-containing protein [Anaerolineales bacterium]